MAKREYAFKNNAQRSIIGSKHTLETAPGYWYKPRKYSVHGDATIKEAGASSLDLPDEVLGEIADLAEKETITADSSTQEMIKHLSVNSKAKLLQSRAKSVGNEVAVMKLILLYGIGLHNFFDKDGDSAEVDDELVENLLEYKDMAQEIITGIGEYNSPLPVEPEQTSETLLNGLTQEQTSESETDLKMVQETL